MPSAIKLSDAFVEIAREEGRVMHRSIAAQVEYWARLGREIEATGAISPAAIRRLLSSGRSVQDHNREEDALYVKSLTSMLEGLDGSDTRILDDLRAGGHPIASEAADGRVKIDKGRRAG